MADETEVVTTEAGSGEGASSQGGATTPDETQGTQGTGTGTIDQDEGIEIPGKKGQYIPYSRFKEKVDQYNDAQERIAEFERSNAGIETQQAEINRWLATIDAIKKDPALLRESLKELGIDFDQVAAQEPDELKSLMRKVETLEQSLNEGKANIANDRIVNEFHGKVDALFGQNSIPKDKQEAYRRMISSEVILQDAKISDIGRIFKDIHKMFSGFTAGQVASYVKNKTGEGVPASSTAGGMSPIPKENLKTPQDRVRFVAEGLKKAMSMTNE